MTDAERYFKEKHREATWLHKNLRSLMDRYYKFGFNHAELTDYYPNLRPENKRKYKKRISKMLQKS